MVAMNILEAGSPASNTAVSSSKRLATFDFPHRFSLEVTHKL